MDRRFLPLLLPFIFAASMALAEDPSSPGPALDISHTPPKPSELPSPGKTLSLTAMLKRNPAFADSRMNAIIVSDGRLMEIQNREPTFDDQDRLKFTVDIPAPITELAYQFVLFDSKGSSTISRRYSVKRECIPDIKLTSLERTSQDSGTQGEVVALVEQSSGLEKDIGLYESAVSILSQIQQLVEKK